MTLTVSAEFIYNENLTNFQSCWRVSNQISRWDKIVNTDKIQVRQNVNTSWFVFKSPSRNKKFHIRNIVVPNCKLQYVTVRWMFNPVNNYCSFCKQYLKWIIIKLKLAGISRLLTSIIFSDPLWIGWIPGFKLRLLRFKNHFKWYETRSNFLGTENKKSTF